MANIGDGKLNFDLLVSELSQSERKSLLDKLIDQSTISSEPLYIKEERREKEYFGQSIRGQYASQPLWMRIWFVIWNIFSNLSPVELFAEWQANRIGRQIERQYPTLYNPKQKKLLLGFYNRLEELKEASRFFYTALDAGFQDREAFFAFLGSLEMAPIHERLLAGTDLQALINAHPEASDAELRQTLYRNLDTTLTCITEQQRNIMYADVRYLFCLKRLASFPFDKVLVLFIPDPRARGRTCTLAAVGDYLASLNDILYSIADIPSMPLLESLFIFLLQEKEGSPDINISKDALSYLPKAEKALQGIRTFNEQVPLSKLLHCLGEETVPPPQPVSGGEEWFAIYRGYWKHRVDDVWANYRREQRQKEMTASFSRFLERSTTETLESTVLDGEEEIIPIRGIQGLSFLQAFHHEIFLPRLNPFLEPILMDGIFFRFENRVEFAESYRELVNLGETISLFKSTLTPAGDFGERYIQAKQGISSRLVKRQKLQSMVEDASLKALAIIDAVRHSCQSMVYLLGGILGKNPKNGYSGLSKIPQLSDRSMNFLSGIEDALEKFNALSLLLSDLGVMEK